ncbi:MAG TPA: ATP-binding protein [Anaerolineae bacterium]|nr:ATP-binding protein [Anaerolineae bacterium]
MVKRIAKVPETTDPNRWHPYPPKSVKETGLSEGFISDLLLKVLYFQGQLTGYELADKIHLPYQNVTSDALEFLKREQMCEVTGKGSGVGSGAYQYVITTKGATRAREQLQRTAYTGPAPVPWPEYVKAMKAQGTQRLQVNPQMMAKALSHLILDDMVVSKLGPAVNSGKSMFLYGPPGNGKTTIAESIGRMVLQSDMYVPHAVDIDGQLVKVFDGINHVPAVPETDRGGNPVKYDKRWVRIKRPVIMVGGELTMDGLELIYDDTNKYYEAPFQMKANGGMFLIDDFGRQQIRPRDLLNRWIVPMERRTDFLALHTGRKVEVPFEVLIVFSTNLPPKDLVDEAFLRRIRHKIEVTSPSYEEYRDIFKRVCQAKGVGYDENLVKYLLQEHYVNHKRPVRASHPRDIIDQILDVASYLGHDPVLSKELVDRAVGAYFVDL